MSKRAVTLYLHVHQPYRLGRYTAFDTAERHDYFKTEAGDIRQDNEAIFKKVAEKSYRPMNRLLEKLLQAHPEFRLSLSITGTFIEQAEAWDPELIRSFQRLTATGRVEIVAETYHHSLAFFYSRMEFEKQVLMHREMVERLFSQTPKVFRNTELAYNDDLAEWADGA
ncbi:MAG TPA: polysaccharide deacetylase family protein, partial [Candidatus Saccharimonadales bacterium]|nr:polysaccharide deacetylase family protein [Candidatus Saccharimonadales bacterium]